MADWTNISTDYFGFTYEDTADTYPSKNNMKVRLQYDKDSVTATSAKVRFKCYLSDGDYTGKDGLYILYDANDSSELRSVYEIKKHNEDDAEAYYTSAITLTKSYSTETFFLQDIWVCNTGEGEVTVSSMKVKYASGTYTFYELFKDGGLREGYAYRQTKGQDVPIYTSKTVATAIEKGSTTITDNGNNTFTITATKGKDGTNNPAKGLINLEYGYTDSYGTAYTNGATIKLTISGTGETRTVYATSTTEATYGSNKVATTSKAIKQYLAPLASSTTPTIGYTKTRLTTKENWKLSWGAGTKQGASGVAGYRIRIYVNDQSIPIKNSAGTVISYNSGGNKDSYYYDTESTATSFTFYAPLETEYIKPDDKVYLMVYAYSKDGTGYKNFSAQKVSSTLTVYNAATVNIKPTANTWAEGQVWIKDTTGWHEATSVYIKDSTGWHESK